MNIQADNACSVAAGAAKRAGVVGKIACLITLFLCICGFCIQLSQLVVNARVGGDRRTDIDPDGCGVNELNVRDAIGADFADVRRKCRACNTGFQRRDKTFQHHCRFSGAGNAGDDGKPAFRNICLQRFDGMDLSGRQMNPSLCEKLLLRDAASRVRFAAAFKERRDLRSRICFNGRDCPLGDNIAAFCTCLRSHFHDPVGFLQNLRIVVDQNDGITVGYQIVHHAGQPHNVCRVQTDGRLIQHIQNACRAVADGACKLHPLALAGGERGGGTVKREIPQPQIRQPLGGALERLADAFRHRAHFLRQAAGNAPHPFRKPGKRHRAGFIQRDPPQLRGAGGIGKAGAAAIRADIFFQKFLYALHALFVPDLGEGVFNGEDGVVIGEIQFPCLIRTLCVVKNMLFLRRTVVDDLLFFRGQLTERHIGTHAHFAADIRHQRPHQAVPRGDRAPVNAECVIRHKAFDIYCPHAAGAAALLTGTLGVERQFLGGRCVKMSAALRTNELFSCGDSQRRFQIMTVRAAVACKAGVYQPQAVQQLGSRTEGAADARHSGALVKRQRSGNIQNFIHGSFGCLRHAAAGVGGERFEVSA